MRLWVRSYKSKIRDHASGAKVLGSNKSKRRDHASGAAVFEIIILKVAAGRLGGRTRPGLHLGILTRKQLGGESPCGS